MRKITKNKIFIEIISGLKNKSICLNGIRIAGLKPEAGSIVTDRFCTTIENILSSLISTKLPREYILWDNGFYKIKIEKLKEIKGEQK